MVPPDFIKVTCCLEAICLKLKTNMKKISYEAPNQQKAGVAEGLVLTTKKT